jgi:hypothetical protein
MLKKPASFVLASFRPSTVPRGYAFGSSRAAALLNGLFEHPTEMFSYCVIDADGQNSNLVQSYSVNDGMAGDGIRRPVQAATPTLTENLSGRFGT